MRSARTRSLGYILKNSALAYERHSPPCVLLSGFYQSRIVQSRTRFLKLSSYSRELRDAAALEEHRPADNGETILPLRTTTIKALPETCPGCGALTQSTAPKLAGYYSVTGSRIKRFLDPSKGSRSSEKEIFAATLANASEEVKAQLGITEDTWKNSKAKQEVKEPLCDRCHDIAHKGKGESVAHPSIESIRRTIGESPYRRNHIYHLIDAVDFPLSVIPNLTESLRLPPLRTQNRRSKHRNLGRVAEVSFIITRADLLANRKEDVDRLMPYMRDILRKALGNASQVYRLGNVCMVSAKRGWWTRTVKEDILSRGGAAWLVGKVNVGKSNFFEVVFPKGSQSSETTAEQPTKERSTKNYLSYPHEQDSADTLREEPQTMEELPEYDPLSLLPPPQKEQPYPVMPLVSDLPGTTASPIRIPFGNGKGEVIDLPGLARSALEKHVRPERRRDLVMTSKPTPQRFVLNPGKSLLLGGLFRLTPRTPDLTYIVHPYIPFGCHLTSTLKAEEVDSRAREINVDTIVNELGRKAMSSAGTFTLSWEATKPHAGPLTTKSAADIKVEKLPFKVYAADILIEGCGWVEVTAQVRKVKNEKTDDEISETYGQELPPVTFPEIEMFSPEGKFVNVRRPMNASTIKGNSVKKIKTTRPRMSMKSVKARRKPATK